MASHLHDRKHTNRNNHVKYCIDAFRLCVLHLVSLLYSTARAAPRGAKAWPRHPSLASRMPRACGGSEGTQVSAIRVELQSDVHPVMSKAHVNPWLSNVSKWPLFFGPLATCSRFTFESHGFTWALDMTGCTSDCSSTRMALTFVPSDPPQARGIREDKHGCRGHALAPLGARGLCWDESAEERAQVKARL